MIYDYKQSIRGNNIVAFEICITIKEFDYCIILFYDRKLDTDNRLFQIYFQDREPWYVEVERFDQKKGCLEVNDNVFKLLKSKDKLTQSIGIELIKQSINYE